MNPISNIWNYDYVQQQAQQHHNEQIWNVADSVKKLKDFLDSTDKIEPEYQNMASVEFCALLMDYFQKHSK